MLHAVNVAAEQAGLAAGMALADARALLPGLAVEPADPAADAAALERLARWCVRYSPWVRPDPPGGVLLDASGCAHLWGGEKAMLSDLQGRLASAGIRARLAMADTPGAAHALARHGADGITIAPAGGSRAAIAGLPVTALRIGAAAARSLRRLGLKRIGDLMDLPRASLARRFGPGGARAAGAVLHRLNQALGHVAEPVAPMDPAPAWRVRRGFAEPVTDPAALPGLVTPLLDDLTALLEAHGAGARRIALTACRADGTAGRIAAGVGQPSRDVAHLARLLAGRLETLDPGFGIDTLILGAEAVAPLAPAQADLDGRTASRLALSALVDRLALRLGPGRVGHMIPHESHVPERAERRRPGAGAADWGAARRPPGPPRPLMLLARPEPVAVMAEIPEGPPLRFVWRRVSCRVVRSQGPERIAPEWWRETDAGSEIRDYYRIEDSEGRRFWLFRAGLYGATATGAPPRWFLHGLFA